MMAKKIYLSPENRPGPHGPYAGYAGVYEHDVCTNIADCEKQALERCGFAVTLAEPGSTMAERVTEANRGGYALYQTVHTNAGGGTGAECLYYNHPASIKANQCVYDELTKLYPSKRGIKDGSGYLENNQTNMVSVYPEIAFHDNEKDARFLVNNVKEIGEALCKGVCAYFGVSYVAPKEEDSTDYKALYLELEGKYKKLKLKHENLMEDLGILAEKYR